MEMHEIAENYNRDGYVSPVPVLSHDEAVAHRKILEDAERKHGKLHYKAKMHTIMPSVHALVTHPKVLDAVQSILGPDILLYDSEFIIKEPESKSFVSWHQDLTYWGLSHDDQVSLWLALSPATQESGCMRMIAGSHQWGKLDHSKTEGSDNVLLQGQTVKGVDESAAILCPLAPGEASFHHGWVLHASMPNNSKDRRIGLNAQFIAPHVRQTKHDKDTALLVRGEDRYKHFAYDRPARAPFESDAMARWHELNRLHVETQGS